MRLTVILCFIVAIVALCGCHQQADSLIGSWHETSQSGNPGPSSESTYKTDGTYEIRTSLQGKTLVSRGTYTVSDDTFTESPTEMVLVTGEVVQTARPPVKMKMNWVSPDEVHLQSEPDAKSQFDIKLIRSGKS